MAQKNRTQLDSANSAIDTNGVNAITGAIHHDMNGDFIDSFPTFEDDSTRLRQIEAKKNVALTGGVTTAVLFDTAIPLASYSLSVTCRDSGGNLVTPQIPSSSEIAAGFSILVPITCTMNYTATEI